MNCLSNKKLYTVNRWYLFALFSLFAFHCISFSLKNLDCLLSHRNESTIMCFYIIDCNKQRILEFLCGKPVRNKVGENEQFDVTTTLWQCMKLYNYTTEITKIQMRHSESDSIINTKLTTSFGNSVLLPPPGQLVYSPYGEIRYENLLYHGRR